MAKKRARTVSPPAPIVGSINVVLKPGRSVKDDLINARGEYTSILALNGRGQTFDASLMSVTMPQFKASIDDLDLKEAGVHTKPPTYTAEVRNEARIVMNDNRKLLQSDVQKIARKTPRSAATIIASANMLLKRLGSHTKFVGTKNTKVSGTVLNIAGERGPHDWWQIIDGGASVQIRGSKGEKKTVSGLPVGHRVTYQSAPILAEKDGLGAITTYATITVT
ncbi:MAG: hypothetical protein ACYDCN_03750 [Bacteroidia bacterium]